MYEKTHNGGDVVVFLPCSERKRTDKGGLAVNLYEIGTNNTLLNVLNEKVYDRNVDVFIVSGRHGIIPIDKRIKTYDDEATEDDKQKLMDWFIEFLQDNDYDVGFSFLSGVYQSALNEVGYGRTSKYDIETLLFRPCTRVPSSDGRDTLRAIVSKDVDISSAAEVSW